MSKKTAKPAPKVRLTLSEAAKFVREKSISRRFWKGKHVVRKFSMFQRDGLVKVSYGNFTQTFMPTIKDCTATDWFVVEE